MTVQKTLIPIPMAGGIDTKTDPKQVVNGKLLSMENGYRLRNAELQKRPGCESLGNVVAPTGVITEGRRIATYGDELTLVTNRELFTYAEGTQRWISKGPTDTLSVSVENVLANSFRQTSADSAIANGLVLYAWEDTRGGVRAAVVDAETGAALLTDVSLNSTASRPKCLGIGQYLFVFYVNAAGSSLLARRIDTLDPTSPSAEVTVANNVNTTSQNYDVCVFNEIMIFAYHTSGNTLGFGYYLQANQVGAPITGFPTPTAIAQNPNGCLCVLPGATVSTFHIVWHNTTTGLSTVGLNSDFTTAFAVRSLDIYSTTAVRNVTALIDTGVMSVFWDRNQVDAKNRSVHKTGLTLATNTVVATTTLVRSLSLVSKAFQADGATYVLCAYLSDLQATAFLMRADGFVVAKVLSQVHSGEAARQSQIPQALVRPDGSKAVSVGRRTRIINDGSGLFTTLESLAEARFNFADLSVGESSQLGQNLHIAGGFLLDYDGYSSFEHGFHLYPETPTAVVAAGGSIAAGTYTYQVVWEWVDNKGQVHRSSPSVALSVVVGSASQKVTLTIPTLRVTARRAPLRTEVIASVFRTTAGGATLYKVSSSSAPLYNSTTADTITFEDTLADATLPSREVIYTAGGVLENIAPPAGTLVGTFKNRLVVAGLEDENEFWFSREYVSGEAVNFSDLLIKRVDASGGGITAIGELDEKLVLLKKNEIFVMFGEGPNDTGAQDNFSVPQSLNVDVGCTEPQSVVKTKDGLMFKSAKGIWLLSRSLEAIYIGAEVEAYNSLTITGAVSIEGLNQVRFTTAEGRTLVYDTYFREWYTFTNQASVSSVNYSDRFCFLRSNGEVRRETPDAYQDVNVPIRTRYELAFMQFGGLQGFQRVFELLLLGEYRGAHSLRCKLAYDFRADYTESFRIIPDTLIQGEAYGADAYYGEDVYYGGVQDGVYQFSVRPAQQKCQSLKLLIEDDFPDNTGTAGFALSAISAVVGVLGKGNRLAAQRRLT